LPLADPERETFERQPGSRKRPGFLLPWRNQMVVTVAFLEPGKQGSLEVDLSTF
jgi:hypothetical protein